MVSGIDNPNLTPVADDPGLPPETPAEKPGWQTTEFWLSLIAVLVGTAIASGAVEEGTTLYQALAFIAVALTAMGYQVARRQTKAATAQANAEKVAAYHQRMGFRSYRKITLE